MTGDDDNFFRALADILGMEPVEVTELDPADHFQFKTEMLERAMSYDETLWMKVTHLSSKSIH